MEREIKFRMWKDRWRNRIYRVTHFGQPRYTFQDHGGYLHLLGERLRTFQTRFELRQRRSTDGDA